ncbi:hypothetical protein AB1N83_011628 [Pleurotus pulmonarius]
MIHVCSPGLLFAMRCPDTSTSTEDRTTWVDISRRFVAGSPSTHHANDDLAELFTFMPGLDFISTSFSLGSSCNGQLKR